jgi:hypothetical protein
MLSRSQTVEYGLDLALSYLHGLRTSRRIAPEEYWELEVALAAVKLCKERAGTIGQESLQVAHEGPSLSDWGPDDRG